MLYTYNYRGVTFKVIKLTKDSWYWQIGNAKVHDWYSSKRIAILAAKEYIDENL